MSNFNVIEVIPDLKSMLNKAPFRFSEIDVLLKFQKLSITLLPDTKNETLLYSLKLRIKLT